MVTLSMIKLNGKFKHELSVEKPFAIKVHTDLNFKKSNYDAILSVKDNLVILDTNFGKLQIIDDDLEIQDEEILLIYPKASSLKRFYRPKANSNSLLLTEQCDQRCIMCSQPPKNKNYDNFPLYKEAIFLMPKNSHLGITGGEPTLFKEPLFNFLMEIIEKRNDLTFHILTNGQHFYKDDIKSLFLLSNNVTWGIPLYSHNEKSHDNIVSKDGAYKRLFNSFNYLLSSGSQIELRTVLMRQNVIHLPKLSELIVSQLPWIQVWAIMQLENIGYARMNWKKIFFDNSQNFTNIEKSLSIASAHNINVALYNFPHCTVPGDYRKFSKKSISDWKNKFLEECNKCDKQHICSGFFEWHKNEIGYKNIGPNYI